MRFGNVRTGEGRRSAFVGALLACILVGGVLGWQDRLDAPLVAAMLAAVAVAAVLSRNTVQRPAESRAAEKQVALVASASVIPDPVILVDRRSIVVEANEPARALLPTLKERQPLAFALRDPHVLDAIEAAATTGRPGTIQTGGRVTTEPIYEVRLRRLYSGAEPPLGEPVVALFFRDLTDSKRLERMRVDFIANVSHELRTPLASLAGFIDTLKGPARNDVNAREHFLDIMAAQASRMTRLIDDLLRLSRVELKEHLPPSETVDLQSSVAHMVEVMAPVASERGTSLVLDLPPEQLSIQGDRDEVLRVIENLVENAIKYGGSGRPVEIALRRLDAPGRRDWAEISVRDHGPGIAAEHLPRLTERFYRVDVAESRSRGGTGLGLAIVKHIVGRHRGRLLIESEPGEGATFRAQFPPAPAKEKKLSSALSR